jgi:hypothetical protein
MLTVRRHLLIAGLALAGGLIAVVLCGVISVVLMLHYAPNEILCSASSTVQVISANTETGSRSSASEVVTGSCPAKNSWWWTLPIAGGIGLFVGGSVAMRILRHHEPGSEDAMPSQDALALAD